MVKIWIHKPGGTEPFLLAELSLRDCAAQFDLDAATFCRLGAGADRRGVSAARR